MIKLFIDSLSTAAFGIAMVFAVLVSLIVLIVVLSKVVQLIVPDKSSPAPVAAAPAPEAPAPSLSFDPQALKLKGVDEKTAAMIMAIVCDESGIPANELYFKSITLLES